MKPMQKNNIFKKTTVYLLCTVLVIFIACQPNPDKQSKITYVNFTDELYNLTNKRCSTSDLKELKLKHGRFFDVWFSEIMDYARMSQLPDSIIAQSFNTWLQTNIPVFKILDAHYKKNTQWLPSLEKQWSNLQYKLNNVPNPTVYGYMSQFSNYNTFVDTAKNKLLLGFSQEMFLNDTFPLYQILDVPSFYNRYNDPNQIPTMLIWNYLKGRFESEHTVKTMLDQAVFEGKIWALLIEVAEDLNPNDILGYSAEEWSMMDRDQGQIWRHFLDKKALYNTDFNEFKRYFVYGNQTFGTGIPADCPPMIGNFTGLKIVQKYMQETDCSWDDLFKEHDATKILRLSGYNPAK
jgi:hypothetical protein